MELPPETVQGYEFTSAEIKELTFRFDGIFLPDTPDKFFWFGEVQFQKKFDLSIPLVQLQGGTG